MSELVPAIPAAGVPVSADQVEALEMRIAEVIAEVDDLSTLQEWRDQSAALERYLRGRELQAPVLGAQRRIEAKIGELEGEVAYHGKHGINDRTVADFRIMARALRGECDLEPDEWRRSRRSLVALVKDRLGIAPETPPLPEGMYRTIVADPPWQLTSQGLRVA